MGEKRIRRRHGDYRLLCGVHNRGKGSLCDGRGRGAVYARSGCYSRVRADRFMGQSIKIKMKLGSNSLSGGTAWQIAQDIPMSLLRRKSCSALASTIFESPLHRTKVTCPIFFCAICQTPPPDRPFDTRILQAQCHLVSALIQP